MNKAQIKSILITRGYSEMGAEVASQDLLNLAPKLKLYLEKWLNSGEVTDLKVEGFSICQLMSEYGMKFPAALLSIAWVMENPREAIPAIKSGIR